MNIGEWRKLLNGPVKPENYMKMDAHAQNWYCCAVGAKISADLDLPEIDDPHTPGTVDIPPRLTSKAFELGNDFAEEIQKGKFESAREIFNEIQAMSIEDVILEEYREDIVVTFQEANYDDEYE